MASSLNREQTRARLLEVFADFKEMQFSDALIVRRARLRQLQAALHDHLQACQNQKDAEAEQVLEFITPIA